MSDALPIDARYRNRVEDKARLDSLMTTSRRADSCASHWRLAANLVPSYLMSQCAALIRNLQSLEGLGNCINFADMSTACHQLFLRAGRIPCGSSVRTAVLHSPSGATSLSFSN